MKLHLLHGPAKTASRKKLLELKGKFSQNNVVVFEEGTEAKIILDNLSASSLFLDERLVILENPPEDLELSIVHASLSIVLWFDHEVSEKKAILELVKKNGQVFLFPEGKEISIFPFLTCLANKDKRAFLELERLKGAGFDLQYFITMIFYLLRNLAVTPKNAPQFVKEKLQKQRKNFDLGEIKNLFKEILEIDFKIKSGYLEKAQAEFLIVNKFL